MIKTQGIYFFELNLRDLFGIEKYLIRTATPSPSQRIYRLYPCCAYSQSRFKHLIKTDILYFSTAM